MSMQVVSLGDQVDFGTVANLRDAILAHKGQDLVLDGAQTSHIGGLGVQLLRSAAKEWAQTGHKLTIEGLSEEIQEHVSMLGFTAETLLVWEDDK